MTEAHGDPGEHGDPTARFVELVQRAESEIALDQAALLIAAHAHPTLDVRARLAELDALAAQVTDATPGGVARALFVDSSPSAGAFTGNGVDYYDPANSYLDDVLDRRLGIPITLSVLMIEVARRVGVALHGVGMPGHFLVGVTSGDGDDPWYDPFNGGAELTYDDCAALFARLHAPAPFRPEFLDPSGAHAILDRMLANLQQTLLARDPAAAAWPTRLRLELPNVSPARRAELAGVLGGLGRFSEAAAQFEQSAEQLEGVDPSAAARASHAAAQLRARAN
ncbi:MAG: transglutaminase-like domain-containing protein [Acidimicrobiia bacterium]